MSSPISFIFSTNNLILHTVFAVSLTLLLSFFKIPALLLHGLHTYIHPDDVNPGGNSGGLRAAIRRPGAIGSEQIKPRKKSKERFDFDESKAQIFRLQLNEGHLQSRIYFKEFYSVFNYTLISLLSLLLHRFLRVDKDSGVVRNGNYNPDFIGVGGRLIMVFEVFPKWVLDFSFDSLDGFGKVLFAALMGFVVGILFIPALRNARAFWLGTDQIRCNLSIISCGLFSRMLLYANFILVFFTSLLWINPVAEFLVDSRMNSKNGSNITDKKGEVLNLVGCIGLSRSNFENLRLCCMLISGLLQILALRPNVQMFLNEAVFCWYQRLHGSKVPDLEYSRAKVFLHNHCLCLVVLQFFAPGAMVLLLLGLSPFDNNFLTDIHWPCNNSSCSVFVKEVALFMAWWIIFVWAVHCSVILALYRRGIFYVS
ncbi:uncharacterized protein [Henckelia pumila]|uniref:uncharacterized protein n=1 Tax=Henckelia pumila TaxID=405737 RepID=UPI003C6E1111